MYSTITASSRFKIYAAVALAALLMTMLTVTLAVGKAQATTTTTTTIAPSGDDNPIPQQRGGGRDATPEACPAEGEAASVVDSGHYALFDVYWNPVEKELTNTVCPPEVEFVPAKTGRGGHPARTDREASSINIIAEPPTIIHIPSSAKVDLSTSATYTQTEYSDVWDADGKENRPNAEGTPVPGMGDGIVWVLPACPPDGDPSEVGLCLSFSAALLNPADWLGPEEGAEATIDYLVHHVHQVDIDKQDPRYVLVYDVPAAGATEKGDPLWDSSDARKDEVTVAPGEYNHPLWFFTDRGTYEFQVSIRGYPNTDKDNPESEDGSVSSDVREYIVHVGAEADLGVTTTVAPESTSPSSGDTVSNVIVTITASNAGPDEAEKTKVDVALPDGLTYSSHSTETGTYDTTTGVWSIGEFANGASATLTITATVDAETHGKTLTAKATISATEAVSITEGTEDGGKEVVTYHVPVPDPTPGNDMDTGTTTVTREANVDPMFVVIRSVAEESQGVNLGDPVPVLAGDNDTLTYTLTGVGADNFTASSVAGGVQIAVASGANLDYETKQSYDLALGVSDGKDGAGNDNSSIDDTIAVVIRILDVTELTLSVSASQNFATFGTPVTWTASIHPPLPADATNLVYHWRAYRSYTPYPDAPTSGWQTLSETGSTVTWTMKGPHPANVVMGVSVSYMDGHGNSHSLPEVEGPIVGFDN